MLIAPVAEAAPVWKSGVVIGECEDLEGMQRANAGGLLNLQRR
jgi:hypothetical protein